MLLWRQIDSNTLNRDTLKTIESNKMYKYLHRCTKCNIEVKTTVNGLCAKCDPNASVCIAIPEAIKTADKIFNKIPNKILPIK
ncbi:MAG: hypothetical protein ACFFBD_07215, partial [Candidatus Hodarchaeota archaeon]